jgi:hypothetical protein
LKLFKWTKGGKIIHSLTADASCTRESDPSCGGLDLVERGFTYGGHFATVFPDSVTTRTKFTEAGLAPARVVLCHRSMIDDLKSDTYLVNPSAAQVAAIPNQCLEGSESFYASAQALGTLKELHRWTSSTQKALSLGSGAAPLPGLSLESTVPAGYVVAP